ncbi:MAG: hypothetical protein AMS23_07015 [Bacteroides sp. SM1_62]|nr:MAG: hypothetical protein AMS23_07015 [Bacteroides sp. SM1_62]
MKTFILVSLLLVAYNAFGQESGIIFQEDFETVSIQEMISKWDEAKNNANMSFSGDVPAGSPGSQSLVMTYTQGQNTGGHLYKMFPEGYDSLFARFYVKFDPSHSPVHHFVHMGGYYPPTTWPQGGAGTRPTGNERFTTGIEPIGDHWSWDFYTYWMHMRGYADPNYFWGNTFHPDPSAPINRGEWICVELMMKVNDPVDSYNGEQAFWVNGEKIHHLGEGFPNGYWVWDKFYPHPDSSAFEGFQWRNDDQLKINFFWILYYMTGETDQTEKVYFDDVVVSTEYIGPIVTGINEHTPDTDIKSQVYPNPFTGSITIKYAVEEKGEVNVDVFDALGKWVSTIVKEYQDTGEHSAVFEAGHSASGIYYYRIQTGDRTDNGKMVLLR